MIHRGSPFEKVSTVDSGRGGPVDVVVVLPGRHLRLGELHGHRHQPVAHYPCDEPGGLAEVVRAAAAMIRSTRFRRSSS